MSATTGITRSTVVKQELKIDVNLGTLPDAARLDKVRVTRKADGQEMFLNLRDFDPDPKSKALHTGLHYTVVEGYDPDEGAAYTAPLAICSSYTEDDLAVMTIGEIKRLPEFTRLSIQERGKLNDKTSYIAAVLSKRRPQAVPDEAPARSGGKRAKQRESAVAE